MGLLDLDLGTLLSGAGQFAKDIRAAITGKEPLDAAKAGELAVKAQEIELEVLRAQNGLMLAQAEINKVEAASPDKFVSRWRPAVGWVAVISLALIYWPRAIVALILWTVLVAETRQLTAPPDLGLGDLLGLLGSILGIGWARTFEKIKGVQGQH